MTLHKLGDHLRRGGAATLNHPATYGVSDGAVIAPARYATKTGSAKAGSEFVFETRCIEGDFRPTVLIDSKGSQSNRSEDGLLAARRAGAPASLVPTVGVRYSNRTLLDLELPHRIYDAHVRASSHEGLPVVQQGWYRAVRDATMADLSPLFCASPATLAFGGWDSSRKRGQVRLRSLFVSELFGVVAEADRLRSLFGADAKADPFSRRSGARLDPFGQDFHITPDEYRQLLDVQREHMSDKTVAKLDKEIATAEKKAKGTLVSASSLGFGGVPPATEAPFGVAVPEVRRARSYSLAGLRRLRFGGTEDEDVAARTALLALLLLGAAYADADPDIRAYCDIAAPQGQVLLDMEPVDLDLSIETCTAFLADSIAALPERLAWSGQSITLEGKQSLESGAVADAPEDGPTSA